MNDNEVKNAFDNIEPEPGAQERMYANILKKAAAQKENQNVEENIEAKHPTVQKRRTTPMWQRWGSLAACLAVVIAAGLVVPRILNHAEPDDPPLFSGSPFEDVDGPEGFDRLDIFIEAPEEAENVQYSIVDGEIARIRFYIGDYEYTYEAAKLDGNFSCADGDAVGSISLDAKYDAVLDRLSPDTWRAHWSYNGVSYYLASFDSPSEETMTNVVQELITASCK